MRAKTVGIAFVYVLAGWGGLGLGMGLGGGKGWMETARGGWARCLKRLVPWEEGGGKRGRGKRGARWVFVELHDFGRLAFSFHRHHRPLLLLLALVEEKGGSCCHCWMIMGGFLGGGCPWLLGLGISDGRGREGGREGRKKERKGDEGGCFRLSRRV